MKTKENRVATKGYLCNIWAVALLCNFVAGCGGSGGGTSFANLAKYKAFLNKALSGKPSGHTAATAAKSQASTRRLVKHTPTGRDPIGPGSVYFDDSLQLWVRADIYETQTDEFGATFLIHWDLACFQDQALTQPAGRDYFKEYVDSGKNVAEGGKDFSAGSAAGDHFYSKFIADPVTNNTDEYHENRGQGYTYLNKAHTWWNEATGIQTFAGESIYDNGTWIHVTSTWKADGTVGFGFSDSSGYGVTFNWVPDGSGGFTLAGTDPQLPANGTWNPNGVGTVTFADGGSVPFNLTETGFNF